MPTVVSDVITAAWLEIPKFLLDVWLNKHTESTDNCTFCLNHHLGLSKFTALFYQDLWLQVPKSRNVPLVLFQKP